MVFASLTIMHEKLHLLLRELRIWYDIGMQPFSILLGLGALVGLLLIVWQAPKEEASLYLNAGLWTLFGALVGSRALVVMENYSYYQSQPGEIAQVWLGGLSGMGALAGGLLTILILAAWWDLPVGKLADTLLPLAGAVAITAWLGCWVDRCGYGIQSAGWWALPGRDEWGRLANRVPVQLLGAVFTLVIIWLLDWVGKRTHIRGFNFCHWFVWDICGALLPLLPAG